jgi:LysR family transcriptional regulator, hca operon transcriptional activator
LLTSRPLRYPLPQKFLAVVCRQPPLKGEAPTIDLVVEFHKANTSPILKTFLSRVDDLAQASSGAG